MSLDTEEFCDESGSKRENKGTMKANTPNRSVVWRTELKFVREPLRIPILYQIEVISTVFSFIYLLILKSKNTAKRPSYNMGVHWQLQRIPASSPRATNLNEAWELKVKPTFSLGPLVRKPSTLLLLVQSQECPPLSNSQ